jgi:hypothetical protein
MKAGRPKNPGQRLSLSPTGNEGPQRCELFFRERSVVREVELESP